jgi:GNAT superfamily N-acetyltransferase
MENPKVRVVVLPLAEALATGSPLREAIEGTCLPPKKELRLYGNRVVRMSNDLWMALEEPTVFSRAWAGFVLVGTALLGWGIAYQPYLSLYIAPNYRRLGYGTMLAKALRGKAGDVLVGGSTAGFAFQRKLDSVGSWTRRGWQWLWRRRPHLSSFVDWRTWHLGFSVPWGRRLDVYLLCLHLQITQWQRVGAPLSTCDHGVLLDTMCDQCAHLVEA